MSEPTYDLFISYRRENGAAEARLLRERLMAQGWSVFLDVANLRHGYFDEALLTHIAGAPNFLVVLSPQALDRCVNADDWLRREIAQAIQTRRNIIPLMLPGFTWPAGLPDDIQLLPRHQGIEYSHTYFEEMVARIVESLTLDRAERVKHRQDEQRRQRAQELDVERHRRQELEERSRLEADERERAKAEQRERQRAGQEARQKDRQAARFPSWAWGLAAITFVVTLGLGLWVARAAYHRFMAITAQSNAERPAPVTPPEEAKAAPVVDQNRPAPDRGETPKAGPGASERLIVADDGKKTSDSALPASKPLHQKEVDDIWRVPAKKKSDYDLVQEAAGLRDAGRYDEALTLLHQALRMSPHIVSYRFMHRDVAQVLEKKGDLDGALKEMAISVQLWPKDAWYDYEYYGHLLEKAGRLQEALDQYRMAANAPARRANYDRLSAQLGKK